MATLGELKTRIIAETNRDDLSDDLATVLSRAITQSIDFYASTRFWWNEVRATATCTIGNEYVTKPTNFISIDWLGVTVGGVAYPLRCESFAELEDIASTVTTQGQPYRYAVLGEQVRVWPKPTQAYALTFVGLQALTALASDDDSNAWTTTAQDLIAARARKILFRDQFRDATGAALAQSAENEALAVLMRETAQRLGTGRNRAYG